MKKGLRFTVLVMALLMLLGAVASCKKETPKHSDGTDNSGEPTHSATEPTTDVEEPEETDENGYVIDNIPTVDYKGKTLNVLWWKESADVAVPLDVTNTKDEVLKKTYYQMIELETRLNVNLNISRVNGSFQNKAAFLEAARKAGENSMDLICSFSLWPSILATENLLVDVKTLSYPNLDKPWWPASTEEWSQYGKLFFVSSNSSLTALRSMEVMFCNSTLFTDRQLEDPVELALAGNWTVDKMLELVEAFNNDLDENDPNHIYGLTIDDHSRADALYYGAGFLTTRNNSEGVAELAYTSASDKQLISDFIDKLIPIFGTTATGIAKDKRDWMKEHKTALMVASLGNVTELNDTDYAPMPSPKLNSSQENYRIIQNNGYDVWCVPTSAADPEISGIVIEAIASADYRGIAPFYFDKYMRLRYSSDNKSSAMFQLVRSSVIYNFGRVAGLMDGGTSFEAGLFFRPCFWNYTANVKIGENNFLTIIEGNDTNCKASLLKVLQGYRNSAN